ncbi:hypothetical protein M436DRAFT_47097 [Aureobasidium namibiae CBS 147.97]|uniref:Uncharacterized protein n=1 Tax=Aureobasidium namibiae CBS 147.97 TaxID=1043004 RepID=A0A074WT46_9PEZI|nr:uncharacterized protein M436DRAFT_47097 [Aureobasidium namibiae CBS 147.97]KEQ72932.1 hypothetical protein M436DRAFT_47097 [Aureobasidium namibiae CBS 147.97]
MNCVSADHTAASSQNNMNWPPQSPLDALLSSPKGQKRWQEHRDRMSQERDRDISPSPRKQPLSSSRALQDVIMSDNDDCDDDEEILQLQLQAIQAKLRLKKLQKQKSSQNTHNDDSRPSSENSDSPRKRQKTHSAALDAAVQVSVSPIKSHMPPPAAPEPISPARVRLGIDKGLKASDVSLKRARNGSTLASKSTQRTTLPAEIERPKQSFSDRIAANRLSAEEQQAKHARIERNRSQGFGLAAQGRSFRPTVGFSHDDTPTSTEPATDSSCFESFSSLHLSKRLLPHTTLARALDGKEIYTLPRLLKEIKAPIYEPPDCETDFVVLAIIAAKSTPYDTRPKHKQTSSVEDDNAGPTKFMVMTLTDLKWEVDLFLFDTAFEAFWKMTPGTVVAMLNPTIMPPKTNQHSGKFSLKLASSEDSVMEIGSARDLGFCTSLKKNGQECHSWVNTRKTKHCDFHLEMAINKTRSARMEVNTMYRPNSERDAESHERYYMVPGSRTAASLLDADDLGKADAMRRRLKDKEKDRLLAEKLGQLGNGIGAEYLRQTTGAINAAKNTALDNSNEDAPLYKPSAAELGLVNKDASKVRLSPAKNRRKLFSILPGGTKSTAAGPEAMGWGGYAKRGLGESSRPRNLGPEKGQTKITGTSASAGEKSPKKARFQLAKGIREPGRDSLGGEGTVPLDDSSDDLEII